jgi:hypothetical protein
MAESRRGEAMNDMPNIHDLERTHGVTWGELAGLEPRLNELLWQARASGAGCKCREDAHRVFAPFRDAVGELVGFLGRHRDHPVLGSVGAYEVAYWRLRHAVSGLLPRSADAGHAEKTQAQPLTQIRGGMAA